MSLETDPEIAAAFGGGSSSPPPASSVSDPEISAAFAADAPTKHYEIDRSGLHLDNPVANAFKSVMDSKYNPVNWPQAIADKGADRLASGSLPGEVTNPEAKNPANWKQVEPPSPIAATLLHMAPTLAGAKAAVSGGGTSRLLPEAAAPALSAEEVANQSRAGQSLGAAADGGGAVSGLSPETKAELVSAGRAKLPINQTALERHSLAESLPLPEGTSPLRLRAGQATNNGQQISDEKNLRADPDTHGILANSITDQDQKLVASIGEIQRRATPDIVQRNNAEHGQAAVDAIKSADNASVLDIRSKYKALEQANGGSIPIDAGSFVGKVDDQLASKFLTKTASETPEISEILDSMRARQPMNFEGFEAARTRLGEAQRRGGSAATAAGIVRDNLEKMPLPPEAQNLKGLADTARQAAAQRFDTIKQNPAYKAAIDDNVPKDEHNLHAIGEPSPLANNFMDTYFLGNGKTASGAYINRIKQVIPDEDFHKTIEASALNDLRDAAGVDKLGGGSFTAARYRNARNAMDEKAGSLLGPQSAADTDHLRQVAGFVNDEPKDASTNRSNTALTLQRFGAPEPASPTLLKELTGLTGDAALNHLAPGVSIVKKIGQSIMSKSQEAKAIQAIKDAKLNFAIDATKPGAGLTHPESISAGGGP